MWFRGQPPGPRLDGPLDHRQSEPPVVVSDVWLIGVGGATSTRDLSLAVALLGGSRSGTVPDHVVNAISGARNACLERAGCSVVDESEREAAPAALLDSKRDPNLEERINEGFLVFAEIDRAQSDACDDSFDRGAISLGSGEEHVGGPICEDGVGHVLAAEGIERTRVSDAGRKSGPAVDNRLA